MKPTLLLLLLLAVVFGGCSVKHTDIALSPGDTPVLKSSDTEAERKILSLQKALMSLSPAVSEEEAKALAAAAVLYPRYLAGRYELVSPPYLHNFLIIVGLRERGFCHHWADDLMAYLQQRTFKTLDLYRGVAEQGSLREHHSVVVAAKGQLFSDGILLDAWRGSSDLYFERVTQDRGYTWEENRRYIKQR